MVGDVELMEDLGRNPDKSVCGEEKSNEFELDIEEELE
jgi:hypothetical protein